MREFRLSINDLTGETVPRSRTLAGKVVSAPNRFPCRHQSRYTKNCVSNIDRCRRATALVRNNPQLIALASEAQYGF